MQLQRYKNRSVSALICFVTGSIAVGIYVIGDRANALHLIIDIVPGILIYLGSIFSKGQIGKGDAWVVIVLGLLVRLYQTVETVCLSLCIVCVFYLPILLIKKKSIKTEVPFVPFLEISSICMMISSLG